MDNDVIPMTIAFLRELLGAEAEPAVALILARNEAGDITYGQPLRTFDGRKTLWDSAEELADALNYTLKFLHEWDEVAGLLERAATTTEDIIGHFPGINWEHTRQEIAELRETAARMRKDVARIQPKPAEGTCFDEPCVHCGDIVPMEGQMAFNGVAPLCSSCYVVAYNEAKS